MRPPAGIAIVRVSGPAASLAVATLAGTLPKPRRATLRRFAERGEAIDQGLLLWFPAQSSVTGEDLAEFHVHGGRAVVARLLDALGRLDGVRLAAPGEFSRRAAFNGRLSLAEAEALADLLAADTEAERRAAVAVFDGSLGERIEGWRRRLLALAAEAEALIDHEDESDVVARAGEDSLREGIAGLYADITATLTGPTREELREGLAVVLSGPPNSGKSSLLNALSGREAVLVTPIAGTTRDVIEVPLVIGGRRVRLIDTAGLRETADPVEALGVERARRAANAAHLRIWLGDEAAPPSPVPTLNLHSRCDMPDRVNDEGRLSVSALTGQGLDEVTRWIEEAAALPTDTILLNRRQASVSGKVAQEVGAAGESRDLLLAAEHLRRARLAIDRLTGHAGLEDMLDTLFAGFCVGK